MKQSRNILWNMLGLGIPLLIAALTVPGLIGLIGAERFGFLALAWGLIGYAGVLDLGIGRATTQKVAGLRDGSGEREIPDLICTATRITSVTGLAGMFLIASASMLQVTQFIPHNVTSDSEIQISMLLLGFALPLQAMSATYRGINEAYLNFKRINLLRIGLGAANFGAPFLIALVSTKLYWLIGALVFSRVVALVLYRRFAYASLPERLVVLTGRYRKAQAASLLRFGGWVTVSSIVGPFLVQADRFFVGALISASAITLYVIPYEVTIQALIVVGAVTTVAFPMFSGLLESDARRARQEFQRWLLRVTVGMGVFASTLALALPYILEAWVGEHISAVSIAVGKVLCLGVFLNSIGAMLHAFLHANGQARVTALFNLAEVPIFFALLYFLITRFGVLGAAMAWVMRVAMDTTLLAIAYLMGASAMGKSK